MMRILASHQRCSSRIFRENAGGLFGCLAGFFKLRNLHAELPEHVHGITLHDQSRTKIWHSYAYFLYYCSCVSNQSVAVI